MFSLGTLHKGNFCLLHILRVSIIYYKCVYTVERIVEMDLLELREQIDDIDKQIVELYEKRFLFTTVCNILMYAELEC